MSLSKTEIAKKYGKSKCNDVYYFLIRLERDFNYPYSDEKLQEMIVDFNEYSESDFSRSLTKLEKMTFYGPINRSHIRKACSEAKADRIREEQLKEPPPPIKKGCPMPADFKARIAKSLS